MLLKDFLSLYGLDYKECQFVRYGLYKSILDEMEEIGTKEYCSVYMPNKKKKYLLYFVGTNNKYSILKGIYKINGYTNLEDYKKSLPKDSKGYMELEELPFSKELVNRLEVQYEKTYAYPSDFSEVKVSAYYPEINKRNHRGFISYEDIELMFDELKEIIDEGYEDWIKPLKSINAIYMMIDTKTGKSYIGSSYGRDGLYGRWSTYVGTNGEGGNVDLIKRNIEEREAYKNFKYIVLKVLPLNISQKEACSYEDKYKIRFMTREFGNNEN